MAKQIAKAAALIAAQRKQIEGACLVCGKPFTATNRRRYCSSPCKLKAWRAKRPRAQPATGQEPD